MSINLLCDCFHGSPLQYASGLAACVLHYLTCTPKKYLDDLKKEINATKSKIASGEQPAFDTVDALLAKLEED